MSSYLDESERWRGWLRPMTVCAHGIAMMERFRLPTWAELIQLAINNERR